MAERITQRTVERQQPGNKDGFLFDDKLSGFGVRITPKGTKTYFVEVTIRRRRSRVMIGRAGVLSATQAREEAEKIVADVIRGRDPVAERRRLRHAPTLRELGEAYLAANVERDRGGDVPEDRSASPELVALLRSRGGGRSGRRSGRAIRRSTAKLYRLHLRRHLIPSLGHRLVTDIDTGDVMALMRRLADRPTTANRVRELLSTLMNVAEVVELRPRHTNPCFGTPLNALAARERILTEDEMARIGLALEQVENEGRYGAGMTTCLRLLFLTGYRKDEIRLLQWQDLDLFRKSVTFARTKGSGRQVRSLGNTAVDYLLRIPRRSAYVCGNASGTSAVSPSGLFRTWRAICNRAGIADLRIHDLRHNLVSIGVGESATLAEIGRVVGHTSVRSTERYTHLLATREREIVDRASAKVAAWLAKRPDPGLETTATAPLLRPCEVA